jgi:Fic family protein
MADLVNWYNDEERLGEMHPVDLAILFHYRYIRIHPFEDGNGRIARLLVNYILARHGYPMVVVRSRKKKEYLEALHQADLKVGSAPSDGSHASLQSIRPFRNYFTRLVESEIKADIDFVLDNDPDGWWFDGERIKFQSATNGQILKAMKFNPNVQIAELAEMTGVSRIAIQKTVKLLADKGYIMRDVGKYARWHVCITNAKD